MRRSLRFVRATCLIVNLAATSACGIVGPSCTDESRALLNVSGQVAVGGTSAHTVISPKNSNLRMRLTWPDTAATLGLRATITSCGGHTGCVMDTVTPPFGPGGSSPVPQPWPPGLREMLVDGWQGKTWFIEVTNPGDRDASFTLQVTSEIACER
jgi:hypothetical protein